MGFTLFLPLMIYWSQSSPFSIMKFYYEIMQRNIAIVNAISLALFRELFENNDKDEE